ncbi:MAG: tetratricopeptide repeat protein [Butyrivibrio sp.]|nr:tetratricopeptide repeat protein [Butyrivibrio sp.]
MKCPGCGLEIPEGQMFCNSCGTEINIVPDFEPEVENEIDATLSGLADELNKDDQASGKNGDRRKNSSGFFGENAERMRLMINVALVFLLVAIGVGAFLIYMNNTGLRYVRMAEEARQAGNLSQAIGYLKQANKENPTNSDIIFRMSDYYLENGDVTEAIDSLKLITESDLFPEDKVRTAYESMISVYRQTGDYKGIEEMLSSGDGEIVTSMRSKYVPNMPSMSPSSGTYESVSVSLSLLDGSGNKIYYTVNDGEPDEGSILYESNIVLTDEGTYNVKAVAVNEFGIASVVSENEYVIERGAPLPPEIMEPSGDYYQNTMIVAVAEAGVSIFYTTDGSVPTMESKQYISPITMPVGTSHFNFIAFDNAGNASEIVERDYHLVYTRLVSTEQAVNNLVNTLVRLDILLDTSGKVRGIEGHNEYIYNSIIEIEGAGEYYVVVENHVLNDGTSAPTGLMYAVNTHDGTVNRLGYDSSGKYTLITISNR